MLGIGKSYTRAMQVRTSQSNDALVRQKQRLQERAAQDRARAAELSESGAQDQTEAGRLEDAAVQNREKGEQLAQESKRLRRNGRRQSKRGLERLGQAATNFSDSFAKQESGLSDLKAATLALDAAAQSKSGALDKINSGLATQSEQNSAQLGHTDALKENTTGSAELLQQKQTSASALSDNVQARGGELNNQTERVADFILAGDQFDQASATKAAGVNTMAQAIGHKVNGESLNDAKSHQELQQTWGEADASRHQGTERDLVFRSVYESVKSHAAKATAAFHESAAQKGDAKAGRLESQAAHMRAHADDVFAQAMNLQHCGHNHIVTGQRLQCCPWTYCQGVALERQGRAELAQAQQLKSQAQSMRADAQAKALEAETARVKAEQAREVSEEFSVQGHGHEVRSNILDERSEVHKQKAVDATEKAAQAESAAARLGEAARGEKDQAKNLHQQGVEQFSSGMTEQTTALKSQRQSVQGFNTSLSTEQDLHNQAKGETENVVGALSRGRSFLSGSRSLVNEFRQSLVQESQAQDEVRTGIADLESGVAESLTQTEKAKRAAALLEEARSLELEGLKLQNRGQKMLLAARPKMADAAKLSAQSFDAFRTAGNQEEQAEALINKGQQKIAAAEILKQKAQAYETLAQTA